MERHVFQIEPLPPFRLDLAATVLQRTSANRIDRVEGGTYRRLLEFTDGSMALVTVRSIGNTRPRLEVTLVGTFRDASAAEREARQTLNRIFGLDVDLREFYPIAARHPRLGLLSRQLRGLKPQRFPTLFETLLNCICCQQVSLPVGLKALSRIADAYGRRLEVDGETYVAPPRPEVIADLDPSRLRDLGLSRRKGEYLVGVARALCEGTLRESELASATDAQAEQVLTTMRGLGRWSARYILLRGLGRWDAFPVTDVGASRTLARFLGLADRPLPPEQVEALISSWQPYRGLLYFHLIAWKRGQRGGIAARKQSP